MNANRAPYAPPRTLAADLRRPNVLIGLALWCGLFAVLITLSALG